MRTTLHGLLGGWRQLSIRPWTCPQCTTITTTATTRSSSIVHQARREYSRARTPQARTIKLIRNKRATNRIFLGVATVTIAATSYWMRDDIRHAYFAVVRSARVVQTLYVNIQDYRTLMKEQFQDADIETASWKDCHKRCAVRTLKVLEANGSIFIKLGQHLTSMGYLLPTEWTTTFIPLQDKCPVSSYESIREMYLTDTGRTLEDDFESFSPQPLGAASLAQVHTGVLKGTSQEVAIKVQHPTLDEWVPLDLGLTRYAFKTLKRAFPDYDMEWLSKEMDFSLPQELNFVTEGENATMAREYFSKNTNFPLIIPKVILAERRILVMDKVSGSRIDNLEYLDSHNISRDEVSATLARLFNTMIFSSGAPLHCDPHGGNIAIRHNPKKRYPYNFDLILYDHGLYRMPDDKMRRDYAKMWLSVIDGDEAGMRKYAYEIGGITDEQFPLFASAITGRDYRVLVKGKVASASRDSEEKEFITSKMGEGLLEQLVQLLGQVPRIILLILKTNDLTRSLDESLHTTQGPVRTFLILAKYASRTVWEEQKELIRQRNSDGSSSNSKFYFLRPSNVGHLLVAWLSFVRVELKLFAYERYLSVRRHLHLDSN